MLSRFTCKEKREYQLLSIGEFWASECVWTLFGEGPSPTAFFFSFFIIVLFEWTYNKYKTVLPFLLLFTW